MTAVKQTAVGHQAIGVTMNSVKCHRLPRGYGLFVWTCEYEHDDRLHVNYVNDLVIPIKFLNKTFLIWIEKV